MVNRILQRQANRFYKGIRDDSQLGELELIFSK